MADERKPQQRRTDNSKIEALTESVWTRAVTRLSVIIMSVSMPLLFNAAMGMLRDIHDTDRQQSEALLKMGQSMQEVILPKIANLEDRTYTSAKDINELRVDFASVKARLTK